MAFIKRNNSNNQQKIQTTSKQIKSVDEIIAINSAKTKQQRIAEDFKLQAIEVLNILEKQGIDLYDENRYPGMYLRQNRGKRKFNIKQQEKQDKKKQNFLKKILNK